MTASETPTRPAVDALLSALERTEDRLRAAIQGRPVRDLAETYGENEHARWLAAEGREDPEPRPADDEALRALVNRWRHGPGAIGEAGLGMAHCADELEVALAGRAVLLDLLRRMRDWCLDGDEPDAPDGTPRLLEMVNAALAGGASAVPPVDATGETLPVVRCGDCGTVVDLPDLAERYVRMRARASAVPVDRPGQITDEMIARATAAALEAPSGSAMEAALRAALADRPQVLPEGTLATMVVFRVLALADAWDEEAAEVYDRDALTVPMEKRADTLTRCAAALRDALGDHPAPEPEPAPTAVKRLVDVARAADNLVDETCVDLTEDGCYTIQPADHERLCQALDALGFDPCIDPVPAPEPGPQVGDRVRLRDEERYATVVGSSPCLFVDEQMGTATVSGYWPADEVTVVDRAAAPSGLSEVPEPEPGGGS